MLIKTSKSKFQFYPKTSIQYIMYPRAIVHFSLIQEKFHNLTVVMW